MYYISAFLAILGAVGYQYFVKQIPESINPIVSIFGIYIAALVLGLVLLPLFPPEGGLLKHIRKLNWTQFAVAGSVILLELGFLLMYRHGWNLSIGNLVTGVFVNFILVGLGVWLLGEKVNLINGIGMFLSIIGVALISFRM